MIDTHAHLNLSSFTAEEIPVIVESAVNSGVHTIFNVGTTITTSQIAIDLAETYPLCYAAMGVHPHDANSVTLSEVMLAFDKMSQHSRVKALGEIGLDYYHLHSPIDDQRKLVDALLVRNANQWKLPVIFHMRDAAKDMLEVLRNHLPPAFVIHCFSGDYTLAKQILDLGGHISVTGNITYKKAEELRQVIKQIPLNRLMLETDCPYLTPVPFRGKRNEPAYIRLIAAAIAELRCESVATIAEQTTQTAIEFFHV